jgi:membrane protein EpsK
LSASTFSGKSNLRRSNLSVNLATNLANFGLGILIGFWFTPFMIHNLGTARYGLIPLATTIAGYMTVLTVSVNSSVSRSLTVAISRGDWNEAEKVFSTSVFGLIALGGFLALLLVPAVVWIDHLIQIPTGAEVGARVLFGMVAGAFLLNEMMSPFSVMAFSHNRLELSNLVAMTCTIVRVAVVVVLFRIFTPQLWHVGFGIVLSAFAGGLGGVLIWRTLAPELRVSHAQFDRTTLRGLTSTSSAVILVQIGGLLFLGIDLLIVNRMLGPDAGGRYAVALQWSALLRSLASTVASAFTPSIFALYAGGNTLALVNYARRTVKLLGIFIALPIGLLAGFGHPILNLWLGADYASLAPLLALLVIPLCVNLAIMPLFGIVLAKDAMKQPGIIQLIAGALNLALAVVLCGPAGWGMYGVAAAGAIVLTAKNFLYLPLFTAWLVKRPWFTFYREMGGIVMATGLVGIAALLLSRQFALSSWTRMILATGAVTLVYGAFVWLIALDMEDRRTFWRMLSQFRGRLETVASETESKA